MNSIEKQPSVKGRASRRDFNLRLNRRFFTWIASCLALGLVLPGPTLAGAPNQVQEGEVAGYLLVPNERVQEAYNAGFSMYVAAWPLLQAYPGHRFQTGLFGTWMFAQYDGRAPTNKVRLPSSPPISGPARRWTSRACAGCFWTPVLPSPIGLCRWKPSISPASSHQKAEWVAVRAEDVPVETGLAQVRFNRPREDRPDLAYRRGEDRAGEGNRTHISIRGFGGSGLRKALGTSVWSRGSLTPNHSDANKGVVPSMRAIRWFCT